MVDGYACQSMGVISTAQILIFQLKVMMLGGSTAKAVPIIHFDYCLLGQAAYGFFKALSSKTGIAVRRGKP